MNLRPSLPLVSVAFIGAALLGCSGSSGDSTGSASPSAAKSGAPVASGGATPPAAASTAKPAPVGVKTNGEVESSSGKKIAFTIDLPEGLKDVADAEGSKIMKEYRKEAKKYDSYGFEVMEANEKLVSAGLDGFLEQATKSPEFTKNNVKILDKAKTDNGWYMARSIEEGAKKEVGIMMIVTANGVSLMCRGEVEGALAVPEVAPGVLLGVCKTLKITGS